MGQKEYLRKWCPKYPKFGIKHVFMDSIITVSHKQFKPREKTKNSKYLIVKLRKTKIKKNTYDVGRIMTHAHTR